jgi:hypothetical protein
MVRIVRNVGGIQGLDIALDCFSEAVERRLFESERIHAPQDQSAQNPKRHGIIKGPDRFDHDIFRACNVVRDSGLLPGYVPPDYCFALTYNQRASFQSHFDSRYRWGETVVGVTTGQQGTIYFSPGNAATTKKGPPAGAPPDEGSGPFDSFRTRVLDNFESGYFAIEVDLPRRSIYVMSGAARVDWKHGIRAVGSPMPPPAWNPHNFRRSLTLRATKAFSDASLDAQLAATPHDESLLARCRAQAKFRPETQYQGGRLSDEELDAERARAAEMLRRMASLPTGLRFDAAELTFALPPAAAAASAAAAVSLTAAGGGGGALPWASAGHRLGGSASSASAASAASAASGAAGAAAMEAMEAMAEEQEDAQLQAAIRASLDDHKHAPPPPLRPPSLAAGASTSVDACPHCGKDLSSCGPLRTSRHVDRDCPSRPSAPATAPAPAPALAPAPTVAPADRPALSGGASAAEVQAAVRASPWPFAKGEGHLGVKWRSGVEANRRELDRRIAAGEFTAVQALHRMTDGLTNLDGSVNGPARPTLRSKWGPGGLASVRCPQAVVDAHVDALRAHLAARVAESLGGDGGGEAPPPAKRAKPEKAFVSDEAPPAGEETEEDEIKEVELEEPAETERERLERLREARLRHFAAQGRIGA